MTAKPLESALYVGNVFHQRVVPKRHEFTYNIFLFWLKLDELATVEQRVRGFSTRQFAPAQFKRSDYLGQESLLQDAVLNKMNQLSESDIAGDVYMLGQLRMFGLYFSPVNFYFVRNNQQRFTHMLAEVSNTPWNKRHHYLVDLTTQAPSNKAFHVSPFNPMEMIYHWSVTQPAAQFNLQLSCHQQQRHFTAALNMIQKPLNSKSLGRVLMAIPSMTIKTVIGIYWQALKLLFKRVPIYNYSGNKKEL